MTEQEWRTGTDPEKILKWLMTPDTNWFPDRKPRKFIDPPEHFVRTPSERKLRLLTCAWRELSRCAIYCNLNEEGKWDLNEVLFDHMIRCCREDLRQVVDTEKASLLRCVFGNPFHEAQPPAEKVCRKCGRKAGAIPNVKYCERGGDPDGKNSHDWQPSRPWLTWNDSTVPKLAEAIYRDRAWSFLPMLADALEEAGCSDPGWLDHLRGPGPHCRGCHVLDFILGRE